MGSRAVRFRLVLMMLREKRDWLWLRVGANERKELRRARRLVSIPPYFDDAEREKRDLLSLRAVSTERNGPHAACELFAP